MEKTREELLEEYSACVWEAIRLREALGRIILTIDWAGGKMRDKLEAAADIAEEGLFASDRWKGVEDFEERFLRAKIAAEKAKEAHQ